MSKEPKIMSDGTVMIDGEKYQITIKDSETEKIYIATLVDPKENKAKYAPETDKEGVIFEIEKK